MMNTHPKVSLSDIRTMILCEYPLSAEECGHQYYDGDGVRWLGPMHHGQLGNGEGTKHGSE